MRLFRFFFWFDSFCRNLCLEIGEKTNVYSVEVSMHGFEVSFADPAVENKIIPYSEEDCKFFLKEKCIFVKINLLFHFQIYFMDEE